MSNCRFCNKEIGGRTAGIHVMYCPLNPKRQNTINKIRNTITFKTKINNPLIEFKSNCKNCGKEFIQIVYKKSLNKNKQKICCSPSCSGMYSGKFAKSENISKGLKGKTSWYVDGRSSVTIKCRVCGKDLRYNSSGICRICSKKDPEYRLKLSKALKGKTGGWRARGGSGTNGEYQGYVYQSSWEFAWILYNLNNEIPFERCIEHFPYMIDGKVRKYYPDFKIGNEYYEISGWISPGKKAKFEQFPKDKILHSLTYPEIKPYLDYLRCAGFI